MFQACNIWKITSCVHFIFQQNRQSWHCPYTQHYCIQTIVNTIHKTPANCTTGLYLDSRSMLFYCFSESSSVKRMKILRCFCVVNIWWNDMMMEIQFVSSVHSNDGKNVSNKKFDRLYFVLSNFLHYEKLNLFLNVDEL